MMGGGRWALVSDEQRPRAIESLQHLDSLTHTVTVRPAVQSLQHHPLTSAVQMLSRTAMRMPTVANQIVARRTFSSTRTQLASPYHYPEGPRSNLPFNPLTKFFALRFWGFMGELTSKHSRAESLVLTCLKPPGSSFPSVSLVNHSPQLYPPLPLEYLQSNSLAAQQEPIDVSPWMHLPWPG
jgi:cytochrome c oxidase subunit 7c